MLELQCQWLMGHDITDDHLIMHILANLPKEYAVIDTFLSKIPIAPCYCQMMG